MIRIVCVGPGPEKPLSTPATITNLIPSLESRDPKDGIMTLCNIYHSLKGLSEVTELRERSPQPYPFLLQCILV